MNYAVWDNKRFKLLNSWQITKSSREVSYADFTVDFAGKTIDDLPLAQQEVRIIDNDGNLISMGFVEECKLPELRLSDKIKRELSLTLLTPRQLTTKRTVTIMRTGRLEEITKQAIAPLLEDGFVLKELNIPDKTVTVTLISRTVEEVLNYLSKKYSFYWNIDEFKNIMINSIEYQFSKPATIVNMNTYKETIKGFISLTPTIQNTDYANIINVKNARIFYDNLENNSVNVTLKNGDRLDFENPIDISFATAERVAGNTNSVSFIQNLSIFYGTEDVAQVVSAFSEQGEWNKGINFIDIATDDSTGAKFVLTMDSTFKNLATGVTYKGEGTVTITSIISQTLLRYANMKLINWDEIYKNEGKLTKTGQIEKTLDVENGWFTVEELIDYVRSTFTINDKYTNQVKLVYDKENDFKVGDRLEIDLPKILTQGNFVITSIEQSKEKNNPVISTLELRNTNLLENYIDLFRSSADIEEQTSQIEMEYVVEYSDKDTIKEVHTEEFNGRNPKAYTLNFSLEKEV